jgi:hypothetical protein
MTRIQKFKIGDRFYYNKSADPHIQTVNNLPNYSFFTHTEKKAKSNLDRGPNFMKVAIGPDGSRRPGISVRSSSYQYGSTQTPWQDFHDPDNGLVVYLGDNKVEFKKPPHESEGNKALLEQFELHGSSIIEDRLRSCPILCWDFTKKGQAVFNGFGIITKAELITQLDQKTKTPFTNYKFELAIFSLTAENEEFDWLWIADRKNEKLDSETTLKHAPKAWIEWVKNGARSIENCRRKTYRMLVEKAKDQLVSPSSKKGKILQKIVSFYPAKNKKERFEALASFATELFLKEQNINYTSEWINPTGPDGGVDFVGRIQVGKGLCLLNNTKIVVLGQAKCIEPFPPKKAPAPANGKDIARLVARLQRGWIGVFVTTSHYSDTVQKEVLADRYPVILINGKKLAEIISSYMHERGEKNIDKILKEIDATYEGMISRQRPEALLYK